MLLLGRRAVRIIAGILAIPNKIIRGFPRCLQRTVAMLGHDAVDNNHFSLSLSTTILVYENS
jgi:hypothetical protein